MAAQKDAFRFLDLPLGRFVSILVSSRQANGIDLKRHVLGFVSPYAFITALSSATDPSS